MQRSIRISERVQDGVFRGCVGALLVTTVAFLLVPIVVVFTLSFDARSYLGALPPTEFSWQWYRRFFSNDLYVQGLWTSLRVSLVAVTIAVCTGVAAAVALQRAHFPGREAALALFMAPLIVPTVVVGSSLVLFLGLTGISNGFYRLVAGHILITMPYCIRTTLASLRGVPNVLDEASMGLGATEWDTFWSITLPLAKRGIVAGAIFAFAMSLDDVSVSLFLVEPPYYTLPVALLTQMRANFDLTIAAVGTMLTIFTAVLIIGLDRFVGLDYLFGRGVYRAD